MRVSPEKMKVTLQHKPADGLYSFVRLTGTMTRILTQKVPQIPLGACTVTGVVSLYTLTDKEPVLSSDSRRCCGWIIYGGIPTHWLRKRHTATEGREVVKGSTCLWRSVSGFTHLCILKDDCLHIQISLSSMIVLWIRHTFFHFFSLFSKTGCYIGHNATVHLTSEEVRETRQMWTDGLSALFIFIMLSCLLPRALPITHLKSAEPLFMQ